MIMLSLYSTAWLTLTATVGQLQQSDIPHQEPAIITNISRYMEPHYRVNPSYLGHLKIKIPPKIQFSEIYFYIYRNERVVILDC